MNMHQRTYLSLSPDGFHRIAYTEWDGPATGRTVVCAHGLTRTGRDFDDLARALIDRCRVACMDVVGRGASDWLTDGRYYQYPQYLSDAVGLIARLDVDELDWVGTSMGGLLGMLIAAQPNSPIRRLVLNDIGPSIPRQALSGIAEYLGKAPDFADLEAVADYLSQVHTGFGPLTREQWVHLARYSARQFEDGHYRLAYDPAIADAFGDLPSGDVNLWDYWSRITCPVLVLRGAESDLLRPETVAAMRERGPAPVDVVEFAGVGHAPMLMAPDQIAAVRDWLLQE